MPSRRAFFAAGFGAVLAACGSAKSRVSAGDPTAAAGPTTGQARPATTVASPTTVATATTASSTSTSAGADTVAPITTTATTPVVVPQVLRFSGPAVGGGTIDASSYAGHPVAFWFWAPG